MEPRETDTASARPTDTPAGKYWLQTLGCKANLVDGQGIEAELRARGWVPAESPTDPELALCVVNSCTVTDEADRQSRKLASRLARKNPAARVVFTGCAAEVDPELAAAAPGVSYVVGNRDKPRLVQLVLDKMSGGGAAPVAPASAAVRPELLGETRGYSELRSRHPIDREWPVIESRFESVGPEALSQRTRAFLKIQDGCDAFCTYCVIPYGRGPSRSLPVAQVVEQVQDLVARGTHEVVLTGINLGDFSQAGSVRPGTSGLDATRLDVLIAALFSDTDLKRLRVSSLDPTEITPRMLDWAESEPRFCPHFHVSLQSPHPRILKLMKRKYGFDEARELLRAVSRLTAPAGGAFVGMDVIAGFPGETQAEFEWTAEALAALPWSRLHVFPYSERAGTPAARLPGSVPPAERARRARVLRELSLARLEGVYREALSALAPAGRALSSVLLEGGVRGPDGTRNWISGYSTNYLRALVRADGPGIAENTIHATLSPSRIVVDREAGDVAFLVD